MGVVKQRLGDLRVHFTKPVSDSIRELVSKTRQSSVEICELCGESGIKFLETRQMGWVEPLCDICRNTCLTLEQHQDKTSKPPVWMLEKNNKLK